MGADPVATFEHFLLLDHMARNGAPELRSAFKEQADDLFHLWLTFPVVIRQRVEEHFKPGCTPVAQSPHLPDTVDPTLRRLVEAAYAHPYNSVEHQRSWLVALDYEEEHCPTRGKDYALHRRVCERLIARIERRD